MVSEADNNNRTVELTSADEAANRQLLASIFCKPTINSAKVIIDSNKNQALDINDIASFLDKQTAEIKSGNLEQIEEMLLQQSYTLQTLFLTMSARMVNNEYHNAKQIYGNLAFKAQAQCRQNLQALIDLKRPRNNTHIHNKAHNQQVNLHEAALDELEALAAQDTQTMTNELLNEANNAPMDRARTPAPS